MTPAKPSTTPSTTTPHDDLRPAISSLLARIAQRAEPELISSLTQATAAWDQADAFAVIDDDLEAEIAATRRRLAAGASPAAPPARRAIALEGLLAVDAAIALVRLFERRLAALLRLRLRAPSPALLPAGRPFLDLSRALATAVAALASYVSGQLVVGVVSVLALVGVLALGLASLARAHRFIAAELTALGAKQPAGELYAARRTQALELRERGVTPDLDVLADATAAQEAERGYTGKYLVATTVLVGLVGTFGGLMETLSRMSPLLKGDLLANNASTLSLIAGPLAGLHVTFGTSVVAILVTLALALIQGDVTLRHERLLALLQERTRHVLIPELWPAQESAAERTVRALADLQTSLSKTLAQGAELTATKVATAVRDEVHRLVETAGAELRESSRAQAAALERAGADAAASAKTTVEAAAQELRATAAASREALTAAAASVAATAKESDARTRADIEKLARAVEATAASNGQALRAELAALAELERESLAKTVAASTEHARAVQAQNADLVGQAVKGLADAAAAVESVAASTGDALRTELAALAELERESLAKAVTATTEHARAVQAQSAALVGQAVEGLTQAAVALEASAAKSAAAVEAVAAASATALRTELAALAELERETLSEAIAATTEQARAAQTQNAELVEQAVAGLSQAVAALESGSSRAATSFTEATAAAVGALGELRESVGSQLGDASRALATAATELDGTVRAIAPPLAELSPQLNALATEVALLATRADTPEQPNAVLDELVRLGEDVERLVAASLASPPAAPVVEMEVEVAAEDAGS